MRGALMQVDGGIRRHERPQCRLVRAARREATRGDEYVARREIAVESRERAQPPIASRFALGAACDFGRVVTILRRLLEKELVRDQRSADLEPRSERADTDDLEVVVALGA